MKKSLALLFTLSFQFLCAESVQTWKSQNGHSFEGTFVGMDAQSVTLRGTDGKEVTVPMAALDAASREQAEKEQGKAKANAPVFTHQNRYLRFSLYPKTNWLKVEFLQGNTVLNNQSYDLTMSFAEVREKGGWKGIHIKEVYGEIEKNRDDVTMRLRMENGVILKFVVSLDDKQELTYSYETEEVPEGLPKLDFRTSLKFPKLLSYDIKTESYIGDLSPTGIVYEKLPDFFKDYEILVKQRDGEDTKISYSDKQTKGYGARAFTVEIPGKKNLEFESPKEAEAGNLYIWFYDGKSAFEGYSIRTLSVGRNKTAAGPFSISLK